MGLLMFQNVGPQYMVVPLDRIEGSFVTSPPMVISGLVSVGSYVQLSTCFFIHESRHKEVSR